LPRLALLRDRLKDRQPELPPMRTHLETGTEYVALGEPDRLTGSAERDAQAAFLRRTSPAASTPAIRSGEDGPNSDVQIP